MRSAYFIVCLLNNKTIIFIFLNFTDFIYDFTVPLAALIVGRDVLLIAFGFYVRYQSLDQPVLKNIIDVYAHLVTYND